MTGKYIVFEGIDGSGKGTQLNFLRDSLVWSYGLNNVVVTRHPGGTPLGAEIRRLLFHNPETCTKVCAPNVANSLMLADHLQNMEATIKPALSEGKIVLSDRSVYSQYAYGSETGFSPTLRKAWKELLPVEPDLIFLLHGDAKILLSRANKRGSDNHQQGKSWNDVETQRAIQSAYFRELDGKENVCFVPAARYRPEETFNSFILPKVQSLLALPQKSSYVEAVQAN